MRRTVVFACFVFLLAACNRPLPVPASDGVSTMAANLSVTSSAFTEGQLFPKKYTCDAENVSPALAWTGAPANTRSLALITDDPDAPAGTWVHWVLYNVPANLSALPEGVAPQGAAASESVLNGALQGRNDFKNVGYGGPCPPRGNPHRYYFKLYALDTTLSLKAGASKADVLRAMEGHILAQGQLMGTYKRA